MLFPFQLTIPKQRGVIQRKRRWGKRKKKRIPSELSNSHIVDRGEMKEDPADLLDFVLDLMEIQYQSVNLLLLFVLF